MLFLSQEIIDQVISNARQDTPITLRYASFFLIPEKNKHHIVLRKFASGQRMEYHTLYIVLRQGIGWTNNPYVRTSELYIYIYLE
jgi:hypothetical protein